MTVKFSVFIPVWNDTRWLPGVIESVLAQTHPEWELIIGDNASTEDVRGIVERYRDERIIYHRWETHVDFASNANRTLGLGSHPWTQYLSADDRLEPGCLAAMAAAVESAAAGGTDVVMVLTACVRVDDRGDSIEGRPFFKTWRRKHLPSGVYGAQDWLRHCAAPGAPPWNIGSLAILRTTLDMAGGFFREEVGFAPDLEIAARISAYGPVAFVNEPLFRYTVRGDSISVGLAMGNLKHAERLPPVGAAIMSALGVHTHRRTVNREERRFYERQFAEELIARALRHRYREGGLGWRFAAQDLWGALRISPRSIVSPRQLVRSGAALLAPAPFLRRINGVLRRRGVYI